MHQPIWLHNYVMTRWAAKMYSEIDAQGLLLQAVSTVTDNWNDLAPDLVIFDKNHNLLMAMEITSHRELRKK